MLIRPPSWDSFVTRLRGRGTETEEEIQQRLVTAQREIEFYNEHRGFYDVELVNSHIESAVEHFCGILEGFIIGKWFFLLYISSNSGKNSNYQIW